MDQLKQAKSGLKITGIILLIGVVAAFAIGLNSITILLLWAFAPILIVSLVLFFVFLFKVLKLKKSNLK